VLDLIKDGSISARSPRDLFEIVWSEGGDPRAIVEARGLKQSPTRRARKVDRRDYRPESDKAEQVRPSATCRLVRRPGDEGSAARPTAGGE